jgi:phosphonate degradation associated HDIG domain protein
MTGTTKAASVAQVLDLFERWGPQRYDEEVSQLEHALQTAALARSAGAGDALVAAALLHDVGHLLELAGGASGVADHDLRHEATGSTYLAGLFPPEVVAPIALHVAAKRYRCAVDPAYAAGLSAGSTASLVRQGGPMTPDEVARFEGLPGHADAVALRGWDDQGKVVDLDVGTLADHRELLTGLAR